MALRFECSRFFLKGKVRQKKKKSYIHKNTVRRGVMKYFEMKYGCFSKCFHLAAHRSYRYVHPAETAPSSVGRPCVQVGRWPHPQVLKRDLAAFGIPNTTWESTAIPIGVLPSTTVALLQPNCT